MSRVATATKLIYMKQTLYVLLAAILLINFHSSANSIPRKGCHFYLSHQMQGNTLVMTSGFTGEYCYGATVATQVFFGNGDQATWTSSETPYTTSYVYTALGDYTVVVYTGGQYSFEFNVIIGQDTTVASGCDSSFVCSPSFDYELLYSQTREEYFLVCTRTDFCEGMEFTWIMGGTSVSVNPVTFPFGKIEDGSVVTVCLKFHYIFCDTSVCEDILFTKGNATVIDAIEDSTPAIHVFPNPVRDELEAEVLNLEDNIVLTFYSFDGRKILSYELETSTQQKEYSINLRNFPGGIYFVKATSGDNFSSMQKIVKE